MEVSSPMSSIIIAAGPMFTYSVAAIVYRFLSIVFFIVIAIAVGFLVYAAKQLKAREGSSDE